MPVITCIEDLRRLARRRVPRMFYDYADSGSWTEGTYRANEADFQRILLRQRVAIDLSTRSTRTRMAGTEVAMPVAIAPTGLTRMYRADGEILAARACEKFDVPERLDHVLLYSRTWPRHQRPLRLRASSPRPAIYPPAHRSRQGGALQRAHGHPRRGHPRPAPQGPDQRPLGAAPADARQPPRPAHQAGAGAPRHAGDEAAGFGNVLGHVKGVSYMGLLSAWTREQFDPRSPGRTWPGSGRNGAAS